MDIFGCDIGNGFCHISVLENEKKDPIAMLPPKLPYAGMPSVAYISDAKNIEVYSNGKSVKEKYGTRKADRLVYAIKTRLKEKTINVDGIKVETDDVYAAIARDLVVLGNEQRVASGKAPIYDLVFAFPNLFVNDLDIINRMQRSIESVVINGHKLNVVARLPEAAAVAVDYLYYMKNVISEELRVKSNKLTVLVYDLGHGTFDTSVACVEEGKAPRLLIKDYALPIGGKNFDEAIVNDLCGQLNKKYGYAPKNENERAKIRDLAVEIKHTLTGDAIYQDLFGIGGQYYDVEMSRDRFEEITSDLLLQTLSKTCEALDEAKSKSIKIDAIVLSGGASQMPMVENALREAIEDKSIPIKIYRPSEAVSFGAARYAYGEKIRLEEERRKEEEGRRRKEEERRKELEKTTGKIVIKQPINKDIPEPKKKEIIRPQPSKVLEQMVDFSYGFVLGNEIKMVIKGNEVLPAKSSPIKLAAANGVVEFRIYRSKKKGSFDSIKDIEGEAQSIQWFRFDFPSAPCYFNVVLTVGEDYNVTVTCTTEDGMRYSKSTADSLDKLYGRGGY